MAKQIDRIEGVLKTFQAMANQSLGKLPEREDVFNDVIGEQIVDTCVAFDTQEWETGISRDGEWTIVEQYDSREEAFTGHQKWVKAINDNPTMELVDLSPWGI